MNICLLFEDTLYREGAYLHPEYGNDGMGGTPYDNIMLGKYLSQLHLEDRVYLLHTSPNELYTGVTDYVYKDQLDALNYIDSNHIDIVVFSVGQTDEWYDTLEKYPCTADFIAWDHNFIRNRELKRLRQSSKVKRVVCVGRELYDRYLDDEIIFKMTYIFNMVNPDAYKQRGRSIPNNVAYIGALTPQKGFHVLAKEWKKVLKHVPDAQLYVAGTGNLYNNQWKLGKYGIAKEEYENNFMRYLLDNDGNILPSVHFLGLIGVKEKRELFALTKVGVVNPTALTETFCNSACEFASAGIPVVTKGQNGTLDTVVHKKTGLLFHYRLGFKNSIIKLLKDDELNYKLSRHGKTFVENNFAPKKITNQWYSLFVSVLNNKQIEICYPQKNLCSKLKFLRVINRKLKNLLNIESIPSLEEICSKLKS